jgi:hypothetical protein
MKILLTLIAAIPLLLTANGHAAAQAGLQFSGAQGWLEGDEGSAIAEKVQYGGRGCYDAAGHGPYPCGPRAPYATPYTGRGGDYGYGGGGYRGGGGGCYDAHGHGPYPCGPSAPYASAHEAPYQSTGRRGGYRRGGCYDAHGHGPYPC